MGGLNVHAEEIDRLARGREGEARVSEHHDAQSDQNDGNMVFVFILNLQSVASVVRLSKTAFAAGNEVEQNHDNGDDQQDVNEPAHGVTGHQTQQPQE